MDLQALASWRTHQEKLVLVEAEVTHRVITLVASLLQLEAAAAQAPQEVTELELQELLLALVALVALDINQQLRACFMQAVAAAV
jgi:hypothetical protein